MSALIAKDKLFYDDGGLRPPIPEGLDPDDPRQREFRLRRATDRTGAAGQRGAAHRQEAAVGRGEHAGHAPEADAFLKDSYRKGWEVV